MKFRLVLLAAMFATTASAQDLQSRFVGHFGLDVSKHYYIPVWSVTNEKTQTPPNTNLFVGLGYHGKSWWLEGMIKKQWNPSGGLVTQDTRFGKKFGKQAKTTLFVETEPFLSQKAFGWSSFVDTEIWKKFLVGVGTENIHRPGPDIVALGPRLGRKLGHFAGIDVSATAEFRFDPLQQQSKITGHPHEIKFYFVFNRRFALTDRK